MTAAVKHKADELPVRGCASSCHDDEQWSCPGHLIKSKFQIMELSPTEGSRAAIVMFEPDHLQMHLKGLPESH